MSKNDCLLNKFSRIYHQSRHIYKCVVVGSWFECIVIITWRYRIFENRLLILVYANSWLNHHWSIFFLFEEIVFFSFLRSSGFRTIAVVSIVCFFLFYPFGLSGGFCTSCPPFEPELLDVTLITSYGWAMRRFRRVVFIKFVVKYCWVNADLIVGLTSWMKL